MRFLFLFFFLSNLVFSSQIQWVENFLEAKNISKNENKALIISFTADWCCFCKKFVEDIFKKDEFADLASSYFVFFSADFTGESISQKKLLENEILKEKYDVKGFPTLVLLDEEGGFISKALYERLSPQKYAEYLIGIFNKYKSNKKRIFKE